MKRSYSAVKESSSKQPSSTGREGPKLDDSPTKDDPLKTETNAFVRSVLRSVDIAGSEDKDTSDADAVFGVVDDDTEVRNPHSGMSNHVASSWEMLGSYSWSHGKKNLRHPLSSKVPGDEAVIEAITVYYGVSDDSFNSCSRE